MRVLTSLSRRVALPLLLVSLLAAAAVAQEEQLGEEAAKRLQTQAEESGRAFLEGDYERLADYTYPKLVELIGGREKLIEVVRKSVEGMKAEGLQPLSSAPSAPTQVLRAGRQTYAIVPLKFKMRAPGQVLVSDSFMIAVSDDGGKNWKFLSGASVDEARLKILLPDAAGKLKLPTVRHSTEPLPAAP
ncbi:MAG TPA: hypothetical protein VN282_19945 [Pyrinomonadaceae bacterium]|nr:hypothetical protein [Pyrinomonadaceae bacterium]